MFQLSLGTRLRRSPYFEATVADGVTAFSTYNRMLMPTAYGDPMAEYWRIIEGVSMWDVAVERQVEISGPDAARLAQILTPRNIARCKVGQGKYVPICNHAGVLINDPILLKLAEDRFWFSIADRDFEDFAAAVAAERGLNVTVFEPDVAPLAVQGPKAEDVIANLFGDWTREIRHFWFRETSLDGIPVVLARSGWSKQGGFEIYLIDPARGGELWAKVKEAGRPHGIGPGAPNQMERIESGLLSFGADTDRATNPFEVRMGAYTTRGLGPEVIGAAALDRIATKGPTRHQLGVVLEGATPLSSNIDWLPVRRENRMIGSVTSSVWSPRMKATIGLALVASAAAAGDEVMVEGPDGVVAARLCELPFL
jgi:aminomethyltransferase